MKKLTTQVLTAVFITFFALTAYANEIKVIADGTEVVFDGQRPVISEGMVLLPVIEIFEHLGFSSSTHDYGNRYILGTMIHSIAINMREPFFTAGANEQRIWPDAPPQRINGSLMLPLRAVEEVLNFLNAANVYFSSEENLITITSRFSSTTLPERRLTDAEIQEWINDYINSGGATELELEIVRLINKIRQEYNLSQVTIDEPLMHAARFYAQQKRMFGRGFAAMGVGHNIGPYATDPEASHGASANVARAFGGNLRWNGGNSITGAFSAEDIVNGWMNSPGHRTYILSPEHRYIGIGRHFTGPAYLFLSADPSGPRPIDPGDSGARKYFTIVSSFRCPAHGHWQINANNDAGQRYIIGHSFIIDSHEVIGPRLNAGDRVVVLNGEPGRFTSDILSHLGVIELIE